MARPTNGGTGGPLPVVRQTISSWLDWPDDVVERLHAWNDAYLLTFRRTGDFFCDGCGRQIAGHPKGNALIRHHRKHHAVPRCEACVVRMARQYEWPPDGLTAARGNLLKERKRLERLGEFMRRQEVHHQKLHRQITTDQLYIDELEARLPADAIAAARLTMRERRAQQTA